MAEQPKEDVIVHFCKDSVFIYPSKEESISGCIFIIEKPSDKQKLLAWTPYYMLEQNNDSQIQKSKQHDLYALKVPLKDIRSIKRYQPTIGIPHIIIVSNTGIAFPPYYFHAGGSREFLNALKDHVNLSKSDEDPNVFYLSEITDDVSQHFLLSSSLDQEHKEKANDNAASPASSKPQQTAPKSKLQDPLSATVETLSWSVLEGFGKVTAFARSATKRGIALKDLERQLSGTVLAIAAPSSPRSQKPSASGVAHSTTLGTFEMLDNELQLKGSLLDSQGHRTKVKELHAEEWIQFFDNEGRLTNIKELKQRIFYGGVEPGIRSEVWKYLLKVYPMNSTFEEREAILKSKRAKYAEWKNMWKTIDADHECKWNKLKSRAHGVEKDVLRTDRTHDFYAGENNDNLRALQDILVTYTFWNWDLGYVQGMNELLSPILYVMGDEADAFLCFKGLMDSVESNFHKDQVGMHDQLVLVAKLLKLMDQGLYEYFEENECLNMFFCFRWLLILFKREFSFHAIQRLWEVLWTDFWTPKFHLFVALAILLKHRERIITNKMQFDDIIKFVNDLSGTLNVEECLAEAEKLYFTFLRACETESTDLGPIMNSNSNHVE